MQKNNPARVIIDTNLWISFLISKKLNQLDHLLLSEKIIILFSTELLDEIRDSIAKPKLKKYFTANAIEEMLLSVADYILLIDVKSKVTACRDTKDNFILSLAKDGKADYLLTGDNDLLELNPFENTQILKIKDFLGLW